MRKESRPENKRVLFVKCEGSLIEWLKERAKENDRTLAAEVRVMLQAIRNQKAA